MIDSTVTTTSGSNTTSAQGSTSGQGEISTFGWDTAFAVRIDNVNAAIKNRGSSPKKFSYSEPTDKSTFCTGDFGDWALVRGGDGSGVNVYIPITNIKGQFKNGSSYTSYSCAGASLIVTVRLKFFDTNGNSQNLKVNPVSTTEDVPIVELYNADFSQYPIEPPMAIYAIQAAVINWSMENLADFSHIFSIVDLNDEADTGAWAFLKPTATSYAYIDGDSDEDAFLGVLAMTLGESTDGLQQVIDKRIVQDNEEGAFCISGALLLKKLVFPNLQVLWPNLQEKQVTFSANMIQLNSGESVNLPETEYQGEYYTPKLQEFNFIIEGPQITIEAYTLTDVQNGVQAWCRTTSHYTIVKGTNQSGQTTLLYQQLGDPVTSNGHYIDETVQITDDILGIVVGIAASVLAAVTGGIAAPIIAIVGALLAGVIMVSPEISGLIENDDSPAIDMLQENIYTPMVWTDSQDFTVQTVDLNGSLRLGGSLGFSSASD